MIISRIQQVAGATGIYNASTTWTITLPSTPTPGNCLFAYINAAATLSISSITIGGTNAAFSLISSNTIAGNNVYIFTLTNIPVSSTATVTMTLSQTSKAFKGIIEEVSGIASVSPLDQFVQGFNTGNSYSTGLTSTTLCNNEYWVNIYNYSNAFSAPVGTSPSNGYTILTGTNLNPTTVDQNGWVGPNGTGFTLNDFSGIIMSYKIVSSVGQAGGSIVDSHSAGATYLALALSFKATSANYGLVQNNTNIYARTAAGDFLLAPSVSSGVWVNLCVVYSGIGATLYVNGTYNGFNSSAVIAYNTGISSFAAGNNGITSTLEVMFGNYGPIQIYNSSLTSSQVQQNFNALRGRYNI